MAADPTLADRLEKFAEDICDQVAATDPAWKHDADDLRAAAAALREAEQLASANRFLLDAVENDAEFHAMADERDAALAEVARLRAERAKVTGHNRPAPRCPHCGATTVGGLPVGIISCDHPWHGDT